MLQVQVELAWKSSDKELDKMDPTEIRGYMHTKKL
jgi:hypothetical protein